MKNLQFVLIFLLSVMVVSALSQEYPILWDDHFEDDDPPAHKNVGWIYYPEQDVAGQVVEQRDGALFVEAGSYGGLVGVGLVETNGIPEIILDQNGNITPETVTLSNTDQWGDPNQVLTCRVNFARFTTSFFHIGTRMPIDPSRGDVDPTESPAYALVLNPLTDQVICGKYEGSMAALDPSSWTYFHEAVPFDFDLQVYYWVKWYLNEGDIKCKVWQGNIIDEPEDWLFEVVDPNPRVEGNFTMFSMMGAPPVPGEGDQFYLDDVVMQYAGQSIDHFSWKETDDYYSIILSEATINSTALEDGDKIGVFALDDNGDPFCAGGVTWPDQGLKAWGDDSQTPEKDGFVPGEQMSFKIWDASCQVELQAEATWATGDGLWGTGSYAKCTLNGHGHYTFRPTDDYYAILIETVTLDDVPLSSGDELAVFTTDDNGNPFCAGATIVCGTPPYQILAYSDDSQTPEKDGFIAGEELVFGMWSTGDQEEYGPPVESNYITGDGKWGTGSYAKINPMRFMRCRETTLDLASGWSWISLNVYPPDDPNMEVVWQDVNSLVIIKGYSGFYIPGEWNGIGDWDVKQMYVPYLSSSEQLFMCGQPVEPSTSIALSQNWNWVSYLPNVPIDAVVALSSIVSDLNICKGYGGFYIPGEWNGIGNMEPGQGYKMHMGQAGTLIYPPGSLLLKTTDKEILSNSESIPSKHFTCTQSAEYQAILIKQINGDELQVGDEISAFTEASKCIGVSVYNGSFPIGIMAWSDVKDTEEIEGYRLGEKMHFRLWENSKGTETELTYQLLQGSDKYGETPLNKVVLTKQTESMIPTEFSLKQNYPNPFNPETHICYDLAKASKVRLVIYSINGKLIRVLEDNNVEAGSYQTLWDGRNEFGEKVASGLYFCHIQTGENRAVRKIVMVK